MAVQQRRNSKTRKAKRRTHYKLAAPTLVKCPACGEYKAEGGRSLSGSTVCLHA